MKLLFSLCFTLVLSCFGLAQNVVRYDLTFEAKDVNYSGKSVKGIAIKGQIPAPTLTFSVGDIAEIHVFNNLTEESSIHRHAILLPNEQDDVSYLTTTPIAPKVTHIFHFPIKQNGTYWYHSPSHLRYCPMKKASWLSDSKEIKNPYDGNNMLDCGSVKATLKKN